MDRACANAHERDPGAAEPGREAPRVESERDAIRNQTEVVEDPRTGDDQRIQLARARDRLDQARYPTRQGQRDPIEYTKQAALGQRYAEWDARYLQGPGNPIRRVALGGADAGDLRVRAHLTQKSEHRLERAVIARVAAAE